MANRRRAATALIVFGVIFLGGGLILVFVPFGFGTVSQWNGRCDSTIGKFTQFVISPVAHGCGLAAIADHAIGWLIGGGIALIVIGLIVRMSAR